MASFLDETSPFNSSHMKQATLEVDVRRRQAQGLEDPDDPESSYFKWSRFWHAALAGEPPPLDETDMLPRPWLPPENHHILWGMDGVPFARSRFSDSNTADYAARLAYAAGSPTSDANSQTQKDADAARIGRLRRDLTSATDPMEYDLNSLTNALANKDMAEFYDSLIMVSQNLTDTHPDTKSERMNRISDMVRDGHGHREPEWTEQVKFISEAVESGPFPEEQREFLRQRLKEAVNMKEREQEPRPRSAPRVFSTLQTLNSAEDWEGHLSGAGNQAPSFGMMYGMHQAIRSYEGP